MMPDSALGRRYSGSPSQPPAKRVSFHWLAGFRPDDGMTQCGPSRNEFNMRHIDEEPGAQAGHPCRAASATVDVRPPGYATSMMNSSFALESLSSADLLSATRDLVQKSRGVEAELLLHLGEVDERKLYLECAFPSMFAFCVDELGFSEDAAYARITVARAARRLPAIVEAVRSGQVHLTGLRMLVPHLIEQNHREVLAQAAGKSKRGVEELVARLSP